MTAQDTSHWRVKGPLGKSVEFDAKTTEMDPNRGIGWNTVEGDVMTSGEIRFEETSPGRTRVEVTMNYANPPGGAVGEKVANILSNPERNLTEDLGNFASIVERGELGGSESQTPSQPNTGHPLFGWYRGRWERKPCGLYTLVGRKNLLSIAIVSLLILVIVAVVAIPILIRVVGEAGRRGPTETKTTLRNRTPAGIKDQDADRRLQVTGFSNRFWSSHAHPG